MKNKRRMNVRALEAVAERAKSQKPQNSELVDSNAMDSHHGISLILKRNPAAALAQRYVSECIEFLYAIASNPEARDRDRLAAIDILLQRGYGKPATVAQQDIELPDIPDCGLERIEAQDEAIAWMNSGKPQHEWPLAVLQHLGLTED